jgi:NtrC-family two-component system response regulator AlgB
LLLQGESGTGKTVFARWICKQSRRADGPFVTVHCPMLSSELMSSTLFGHKKGAFTGAVADSVGKVKEAEAGTLFLDEVADLSADAQARLLRFLHDRTYERLGEAKERKADVRLIAATNRSLEDEVSASRFREDLFFRLNVITLTLPPLRDRRDDLMPLAQHYLQFFESRQGRNNLAFSAPCEAVIASYPWPGNLRQLRNAVERAVILSPASVIEPTDLGLVGAAGEAGLVAATRAKIALGDDISLEELECEHIAQVVARAASSRCANGTKRARERSFAEPTFAGFGVSRSVPWEHCRKRWPGPTLVVLTRVEELVHQRSGQRQGPYARQIRIILGRRIGASSVRW